MHNASMIEKKKAALLSPVMQDSSSVRIVIVVMTFFKSFSSSFALLPEIFTDGKLLQFPIISQESWHKFC
jgi:hypothetical protein